MSPETSVGQRDHWTVISWRWSDRGGVVPAYRHSFAVTGKRRAMRLKPVPLNAQIQRIKVIFEKNKGNRQ